jgi:hypothetical protein
MPATSATLVVVLRRAAFWVALALLLAPPAVVLTWLLRPAWDWLESTTGIESLGHSGPADWCYGATYVALLGLAAALVAVRRQAALDRKHAEDQRSATTRGHR